MSSEQYFKPKLKDLYDGCTFYILLPGKFSPTGKQVYTTQHFHATRLNFYLAVKQEGDSYELNDDVYMKYLDGEQIEAFGFDRINTPPWSYSMAMNAPNIDWFCKGQWFISFNNKFRNMGIYQYDAKNHGQYLHFSGEVRDLNRFVLLVDWVIVSYEKRMMEEALQQNQLLYGNNKKEGGQDRIQISGPGQED